MGNIRLFLVTVVAPWLFAVSACSSRDASPASDTGELRPVPNPPPRYKRVDLSDSGIALPNAGDEGELQIKCGGEEPYVCAMDDGTFRCSNRPCVPACDRVGCLGGEICLPCDGGFRCVASGGHC